MQAAAFDTASPHASHASANSRQSRPAMVAVRPPSSLKALKEALKEAKEALEVSRERQGEPLLREIDEVLRDRGAELLLNSLILAGRGWL